VQARASGGEYDPAEQALQLSLPAAAEN